MFSVALMACETGSSAPPIEPSVNPTAGIGLSVSRAVIATPRTWNAIVDIGVVRTGTFNGTIDLSIEGLPRGVSGTCTTPTLSPVAAGSRVNIEVDNTAAYGTYPLTIRATGAAGSSSTAAISLVVPRPSFAFSADPNIYYDSYVHPLTGARIFYAQTAIVVARDSSFNRALSSSTWSSLRASG